MRHWREKRGLSAQQLSDRTADLGYPVPRSVITNLENDRRDTVSVAELLILAAALDVPPTILVTPVGRNESVEILPNLDLSSWRARGWILGARHPNYRTFSVANWDEARRAIVLYDIHRMLVNEHHQIQNRIRRLTEGEHHPAFVAHALLGEPGQRNDMLTQAVQALVYSIDRLRQHRKVIAAERFVLPELSPAIAIMLRESESDRLRWLTAGALQNEPHDPDDEMIPALLFDLIRSTMRSRQNRPHDGPSEP
jgi:transcriptional regulator with XRE-family HTH domain